VSVSVVSKEFYLNAHLPLVGLIGTPVPAVGFLAQLREVTAKRITKEATALPEKLARNGFRGF
jgi:hypothetical protein